MKKMKKLLLSALALVLAVLMLTGTAATFAPGQVQAASSKEIKEELDELKDEQNELKKKKNELKNQINENMGEMEKLVAQKDVIDQEIFLLNEEVNNINRQIQTYNLLIADKQKELDAAKLRFDTLTEESKDRIRTMEMYGELTYWSILAQANSFGELLDRVSVKGEIAAADERRLEALDEAAKEVEAAQELLAVEKEALEVVRAELDLAQAEMLVKREEADALLVQLINRGAEFDALMDEAELETEELLKEIAQKEKEYNEAKKKEEEAAKPKPSPGGSSGTGGSINAKWSMPIASYTRLSSPYGWRIHPVYGDRRFHSGVDLAAPEGVAILAARDGVVTSASYHSANGYYVTINHGDGYSTSYLHMTHYTVRVGQTVTAGQKIGECGSTGTSTGPHLHFTVYYNGATVNPAQFYNF